MKRVRYQKNRLIVIAALVVVFLLYPIRSFAIESIAIPLQIVGDDIISINLPVVSEGDTSVFDFILDPQGLLYETDAVRYGGGIVEEDATLLFHNSEGEYDFSGQSDWLTVTNRSTVPAQVTITAQVTNLEDIRLAENDDFAESEEPDIYLAIVDDKGNIQPLLADGQASISQEMEAAPDNAYVFRLDEENHTYQYGLSRDPDAIDFDTYSFGLMGACNANAAWEDVSVHPVIEVTWRVEPIISEEEEVSEDKKDISGSGDDLDGDDALAGDPSKDNKGNTGDDPKDENVQPDDSSGKDENVKPDDPSGGDESVKPDDPSGEDENVKSDDPSGEDEDVKPDDPSGEDGGVQPGVSSGKDMSNDAPSKGDNTNG